MNQILVTEINSYTNYSLIKRKKIYLIILFISIIICIIILFYLLFSYFSKLAEKRKTSAVRNAYMLTSTYNSNKNYDAIKLSDTISIIGLLEIPSINISYPILSNSSKELLKISVCKFSGPFPNKPGNLCIAGHNYRNSMMFSKLSKLEINDSIFITDLSNLRLEYIIYEKTKVKENNLECTKNTDDIQITLITCNKINNSERIVIKARAKK